MNISDLYDKIKNEFLNLPGVKDLLDETITAKVDSEPEKTLMPEGDVPSKVKRPEYRVCAEFRGVFGEAYAEKPDGFETAFKGKAEESSDDSETACKVTDCKTTDGAAILYSGTLRQVLDIPVTDKGISAVTVACVNAVMNYMGLCPGTFPDDPRVHEEYANALCSYVVNKYGKQNIVLVGYDGYIVKKFMDEGLDFWTMDKDPDNITKDRFNHVIVNSGRYNREACFAWGKLFIVTGSTLCNGTIMHYLDHGVELMFYGITCSAAATLSGLPWFSTKI